jgi:hypothetical protein
MNNPAIKRLYRELKEIKEDSDCINIIAAEPIQVK